MIRQESMLERAAMKMDCWACGLKRMDEVSNDEVRHKLEVESMGGKHRHIVWICPKERRRTPCKDGVGVRDTGR